MNEWISVKDKLPDKEEIVLIGYFHSPLEDTKLFNKYPQYRDCDQGTGKIFKSMIGDVYCSQIVMGGIDNHLIILDIKLEPTHRQPLPPPPKNK